MDPQAAMQRILDAIADNDAMECHDAADALAWWLSHGGFPPIFTAEMAGFTKYGDLRRYLRLGEKYAIMTRDPNGDEGGWLFVVFDYQGKELARYDLARPA